MQIIDTYCEGTGIEPGTEEDVCHVCNGSKTVEAKGSHGIAEAYSIAAYEKTLEIETKVDDILDKCGDIFEKVSE